MKRKGLLIALIISLGINLGGAGMIAFRFLNRSRFNPSIILKRKLDLSAEQVDSINARMQMTFEQFEPFREELEQKRTQMFALLKEPELDTAGVNALFTEVAELQKQLEIRVFTSLYETMDLLTAEQQAKFFEIMEKNMSRAGGPFPARMRHGRKGPVFKTDTSR